VTAETDAERRQREAEFQQRMKRDGDLGMILCEHLWRHDDDLTLGGETFEQLGCDEVPGYENDLYAVLLRRKSDGLVFEAEIDVSINPVRVAAQVTPLCGPT
jgi:hypothetical protein